jgi:hypothetical protein
MFGLVLTFVACLSGPADGGRCRRVEVPFEGTMQQCMLFGQHEAARWAADHEGWRLHRGWRCVRGRSA